MRTTNISVVFYSLLLVVLDHAMERLCKECNDDFKKLSKKKKKDHTLWKTAERGHVHCLKALLQAGANVNSAEEHDYTPLKFAAMRGRYRMYRGAY